jgi:hypothetical protein
MKKINCLLITLFFPGIISFSYSQNISPNTADSLLKCMIGHWEIKSRFWNPDKQQMDTCEGKASWEKVLNNQYIQEHFELNYFGENLKGQGFMRYSPFYQRFEFIQMDEFSESSLLLIGYWDEKVKILSFRPVSGYSQWGDKEALKLEWDYYFYEDGSFRKEMRFPDRNGKFVFASDYHYFKK